MIPSNRLALTYDHIVLDTPKFSSVVSRTECSTQVQLGVHTFNSPVILANMKCVIDSNIGYNLMKNGYFHIPHRFGDTAKDYDAYNKRAYNENRYSEPYYYTSISVGVKQQDIDFLASISDLPPDYITIDVAHGDHVLVENMIKHIRNLFGTGCLSPFIIAGNVCTPDAVRRLEHLGVQAVKVGIGPGRACTTYKQTGYMSPMFSTIQKCAEIATVPIIADGGVREHGDIAKAIVAGATMVMVGSMFSACIDSPARTKIPLTYKNIKSYIKFLSSTEEKWRPPQYRKEYFGSASQYNKGHNKNVEGTLVTLEGNGCTIEEKLYFIEQSLQSSISYAGGNQLSHLYGAPYSIIL